MPEVIKLSGGSTEPTSGQPPSGSPTPSAPTSPSVLSGSLVSETDALNAASGSNISTITGISGSSVTSVAPGTSVPIAGLMDAKLAVELMDATIPALMVYLCYRIGMKLKKSDLQLTEKEKQTLHPIVQKCLEQLMVNFQNPWVALSVSLITIYGAKIAEKGLPQMFDRKQQKLEEDARKQTSNLSAVASPNTSAQKMETDSSVIQGSNSNGTPVQFTNAYYPTEDEIKAKMARGRHGRKRAIELLLQIHQTKLKKQAA